LKVQGWTVGFHMGCDKSGKNDFIDGSIDVLIASSAMATGADGFPKALRFIDFEYSNLGQVPNLSS
jgi:hypothetical protein